MSSSRPVYWLHLSDLHLGMRGKEVFFQVSKEFTHAIEEHAKNVCPAPPDLILLSGDVANTGRAEEYERADAFFASLRLELRKIYGDIDPLLIPVPGNHDMLRPIGRNALAFDVFNRYAESADDDPSVKSLNQFLWDDKDCDLLSPLFPGYLEWFTKQMDTLRQKQGVEIYQSHIPGDIFVRLNLEGAFPLAIVGLNSSWLQYNDADFEKRLSIPTRQFLGPLSTTGLANPLDVFRSDQRALLMMHHPPSWLSTRAQNMFYSEIFLPDRFDMCLFGHMHAGRAQQTAISGGAPRYEFQSPSLCGLEHYGKLDEQRSFGFSFGSISSEGEIRVWPYTRVSLAGKEQAFLPDQSFGSDFSERREGVLIRPKDTAKTDRKKVTPTQANVRSATEGIVLRLMLVNLGSEMHSSIFRFMNEEIARISSSLSIGDPIEIIECSWEGEFTLFLPRAENRAWNELAVQSLQTAFLLSAALKKKSESFGKHGWTPKMGIAIHVEHEGHRLPISSTVRLVGEAIDYVRSMLPKPPKPYLLLSDDAYRYLRHVVSDHSKLENLMKETGLLTEDDEAVQTDIRALSIAPQHLDNGRTDPTFDWETHDIYNVCIWSSSGSLLLGDTHVLPKRMRLDYGRSSDMKVFVERLVKAERVSIVGVTHQTLAQALYQALEERKRQGLGFWEEIRVVFLARQLLDTVLDQRCKAMEIPKANEDRLHGWGQGVREVREFFLSCGADSSQKWECLQFNFMLPFEAKRFDYSDGNSIVQMVPILPNADVRESYCIEATNGYLLHTQLANALDAIMRTATPIVEFNVYGHTEGDLFKLAGVVSQRKWRKFKPDGGVPCFPVSFILLHTRVGGVQRVLLQNRNIFNTGGDFDLYSLISGKVNDEDFFFPELPSDKYRDLAYEVSASGDKNLREELSKNFANELHLTLGDPIGKEMMEDVWVKTALRELNAELGMRVNANRLIPYRDPFILDRDEGFQLYIKLYTLELEPGERAQIDRARPNANLEVFTIDRMHENKDAKKLSVFLCTHFDEYILPLIRDLGVK